MGRDEGVTTLVVCRCDRIEDMAMDHNWSAQHNAASEASPTSFRAVNPHSLDCVSAVHNIHSVHHPATVRIGREASIYRIVLYPFQNLPIY